MSVTRMRRGRGAGVKPVQDVPPVTALTAHRLSLAKQEEARAMEEVEREEKGEQEKGGGE